MDLHIEPIKHGIAKYKGLIVKMHYDYVKTKFAHDLPMELLCDLELILGLPYFTPMLEVVQTFINMFNVKKYILSIL